ncbi:LemA family protein [Candidatus Peregrinibacteria bacterium]|nr:LemA family protein [Candidatus Peregrinibacteria bacterium]
MTYALLAIGVLILYVILIYNGLVNLKNKTESAWADIDTQLKRRYDLIPNLVETVKGYAKHEAGTLEKVTQMRTAAMGAKSLPERNKAENALSEGLKSIFALAENYPDLKANQNFLDLQEELSSVEEEISLARRYYNANVRELNTKIEVFPNKLIAGPFGFTKREFFEASEEERKNVKVDFSDMGK